MAKKVVLQDNNGNKCYPVTRDECILSGNKTLSEKFLELDNKIKKNQSLLADSEEITSVSRGYIGDDGNIVDSGVSNHTDFLPCNDNILYVVKGVSSSNWHIAYYSSADEGSLIKTESYLLSLSEEVVQFFSDKDTANYAKLTVPSSGKIYKLTLFDKSVKEIINEEVEKINKEISEVKEKTTALQAILSEKETIAVISTGFINSQGTVTDSSAALHTDYLTLSDNIVYIAEGISVRSWHIAYYSDTNEGSFIASVPCEQSPSVSVTQLISSDFDAKYARISIANSGKCYKGTLIKKTVKEYIDENLTEVRNVLLDTKTKSVSLELSEGYISSTGEIVSSAMSKHSNFVSIEKDALYSLTSISASNWNIGYYSEANEESLVSLQKMISSTSEKITQELVIPDGATYFRITVPASEDYVLEAKTMSIIEKPVKEYIDELGRKISTKKSNIIAGIDKLGFLKCPYVFDYDYLYVPMYGQSYTIATDGGYKITDTFDDNVYMHHTVNPVGVGVKELKHLSTNQEYIIADFGDIFSRLIKRYAFRKQDILVGSYGQGSRSVMELSKNNGYGEGYHTYEEILEPGIDNAYNAVTTTGKTIGCPFVLYLQGESDTVLSRPTSAADDDSWCKGDKDLYKQHLLKLKTDIQATIMEKLSQEVPPLFIVYTCGNQNFNSLECGIQQAVLELCEENYDIFSVGSYYYMTSMGPHPSPDGRRWLAELFAKQVFEILCNGEETTMRVKKAYIESDTIYLNVKVPYPPLQIDTWTYPLRENYGFCVYNKEEGHLTKIAIKEVIVNDTTIQIVCGQNLEGSSILVTYGNNVAKGGGNVRDNGIWMSNYNYNTNDNGTGDIVYIPLDQEGNPIVGDRYPMQSWMPQFGILVK